MVLQSETRTAITPVLQEAIFRGSKVSGKRDWYSEMHLAMKLTPQPMAFTFSETTLYPFRKKRQNGK
jgi:hypothetical protein